MQETLENLTFTVSLGLSAHAKAEEVEQVYLNSLAVYTVNFYLQLLQFKTDLENCDSENLMTQRLINFAALQVKNYGKIECIPVLVGAKVAHIPPAALKEERLGFVVVQLNEELTEGTLLGFVDKVTQEELSLKHLQSLDYFPEYLDSIPNWLKKLLERLKLVGWEPQPILGTDQTSGYGAAWAGKKENADKGKVCKKINLAEGISAKLWVDIIYENSDSSKIFVEIESDNQTKLPANLELALVDEEEKILAKNRTYQQQDCLRLKPYKTNPDCCVKIKITLDKQTKSEYIDLLLR